MSLGDFFGEFLGGIEELCNKLLMSEIFIITESFLVDFVNHSNLPLLKVILEILNRIELTNVRLNETIKVPESAGYDYVG